MEIKEILLLGLTEPDYSRVEFWKIHQKKSGYSETVFFRKLLSWLEFYSDYIESKIVEKNSLGNMINDYSIPLLNETQMKMGGHLGKNEIAELLGSLKEWRDQFADQIDKINELGEFNKDEKSKSDSKFDAKNNPNNPLTFIDAIYLLLLDEYEANISDKVIEWKKGKDKTGCAVFCNYLFDRKLFVPNRIETAKKFALSRYGNNINTMIEKLRKTKAKEDLEKRTTEMKRLILKIPFGKI